MDAQDDLHRLFDGDAISARRMCMLVLDDFLRLDRLSMLALRLRILSLPADSEMRAALVIQYQWRKCNQELAQANDPVYDLIDKEGQPAAINPRDRWAARRSDTSTNLLGGKPGRASSGVFSSRRGSRSSSATYASSRLMARKRSPTEAEGPLHAKIEHMMGVMLEMKARIDSLPVSNAPGSSDRQRFLKAALGGPGGGGSATKLSSPTGSSNKSVQA